MEIETIECPVCNQDFETEVDTSKDVTEYICPYCGTYCGPVAVVEENKEIAIHRESPYRVVRSSWKRKLRKFKKRHPLLLAFIIAQPFIFLLLWWVTYSVYYFGGYPG